MSKDVIIIGGGIGGLCSGILLLNKGFNVKIIEKNESLGGKINLIEEDKFRFDLTASIVMTPKIYTDIFKDLNRNYKNYFNLKKIDPIYRVFYYDNTYYDFYSDCNKMCNELEKIDKYSSVEFLNFLNKSYKKYLISKVYRY